MLINKSFFGKLFIFSLLLNSLVLIYSQTTQVKDLPNYPYKGKMFSGYLDLSNPIKKLHYFKLCNRRYRYNLVIF